MPKYKALGARACSDPANNWKAGDEVVLPGFGMDQKAVDLAVANRTLEYIGPTESEQAIIDMETEIKKFPEQPKVVKDPEPETEERDLDKDPTPRPPRRRSKASKKATPKKD